MKRTILTWMMTLMMIVSFGQITSISNGESGSSVRTKLNTLITRYNLWPTISTTNGYFLVGNGSNIVSESPSTARASLGLVIGSDVQAYDADLTTLGNGGSGARDFLGLGTSDTPVFNQLFTSTAIFTPAISNDVGDLSVEGCTFSGNNLTVPGDIYPTGEIRSTGNLTISANLQSDDLFLEGAEVAILGGLITGNSLELRTGIGSSGITLNTSTSGQLTVNTADGSVFGSPTGGAQGAGTINAVSVYDDGSLLSDYVFESEFLGKPLEDRWEEYTRKTLDQEIEFVKTNLHLSTIPGREDWKEKRPSIGELQQRLYETIETQFLYIVELHQRLELIEKE